jgi:hypothetical protein
MDLSSRIIAGESTPSGRWVGDRVRPRGGLHAMERCAHRRSAVPPTPVASSFAVSWFQLSLISVSLLISFYILFFHFPFFI